MNSKHYKWARAYNTRRGCKIKENSNKYIRKTIVPKKK